MPTKAVATLAILAFCLLASSLQFDHESNACIIVGCGVTNQNGPCSECAPWEECNCFTPTHRCKPWVHCFQYDRNWTAISPATRVWRCIDSCYETMPCKNTSGVENGPCINTGQGNPCVQYDRVIYSQETVTKFVADGVPCSDVE